MTERARSSVARAGRPRGSSDARARILEAARAAFSERGYDGATMRDVAARTAVDPALIYHYFGSKQQLFVAAMELPFDVGVIAPRVLAGPREGTGERLVGAILELWESPTAGPLLRGLVRSASTDPVAAAMLRGMLLEGPFLALVSAIDRPGGALRAALAASQLFGLAMARHILAVEPLASAPVDVLARAVGPTIQRYLAGDLDGARKEPAG